MHPAFYNFNDGEQECIKKFDESLQNEANLLSRLLVHTEELISQTSGKIKGQEYPDWTIELLLVNNLTILYNSFDRLRKGYLGISQSLLRPVIESIALSMYFFEFPEDEKKYRKDTKSFYAKLKNLGYPVWIEGVIQRVDKEGKKFAKGDHSKGQTWYNFLFRNLCNDASNFLHPNLDYILDVVFMDENGLQQNYAYGPNWKGLDAVKTALWHIIESALFNIIVFDRCFKQHILVNDIKLIQEVVDKLNKWKKAYQEFVKEETAKANKN